MLRALRKIWPTLAGGWQRGSDGKIFVRIRIVYTNQGLWKCGRLYIHRCTCTRIENANELRGRYTRVPRRTKSVHADASTLSLYRMNRLIKADFFVFFFREFDILTLFEYQSVWKVVRIKCKSILHQLVLMRRFMSLDSLFWSWYVRLISRLGENHLTLFETKINMAYSMRKQGMK